MPRPLRAEEPGAIYHVVARGNDRRAVFLDERDYHHFLGVFGCVSQRQGWVCHAYCLLPNHYHLLVQTPQPNLAAGMQRLNSRFAQAFNVSHSHSGHVFQGRYWAGRIEKETYLLAAARYVLLNPVRAGLASRPHDWRWSSCRAALGLAERPPFLTLEWLLAQFGNDLEVARTRLLAYLADRDPSGV